MNKKILAYCILIFTISSIATATASPSVYIDPASTTGLSIGDSFSIDIMVDPAGYGVSDGQIDLSFDTSVLEVTSLTKGDILGSNALNTGSGYDNTVGTVRALLARIGVTTPPTPKGKWATVTFKVKPTATDGTTTIAITSAVLDDENFAPIPGITTTDGIAIIGTTLKPEISISSDKTHYYPGDLFRGYVKINNPGDTGTYDMNLWVEMPNGKKYWFVKEKTVTLKSGLEFKRTYYLPLLPILDKGKYVFHGQIIDTNTGNIVSEDILEVWFKE